jgi:hypothetical protein
VRYLDGEYGVINSWRVVPDELFSIALARYG